MVLCKSDIWSPTLFCLGWPTLAERRLKTRLIMFYKITHALIAIPNNILIPTDSRTRKSHNQTFRHITTQKDTYKWSFFPHTITYNGTSYHRQLSQVHL